MVVAASYNIVDAIFVGRLGPEALAALAITFPIMLIFMALGQGTGVGVSSFISRRLGAGDHEGANQAAGVAITLSILIGGLMVAVCLPNLKGLLRLFGASGPVLPLAESYMSILVVFAVILSTLLVMGNLVRAEGRPGLSAAAMIASAVTNIILDPILIYGLGPVPAMGVAGAAARRRDRDRGPLFRRRSDDGGDPVSSEVGQGWRSVSGGDGRSDRVSRPQCPGADSGDVGAPRSRLCRGRRPISDFAR